MCGIVGYIGEKDNINYILIDGLKRLEYRGYDSAGIAIIKAGKLILNKYKGKISQLEEALISQHSHSTSFNNKLSIGIGHTRWATHGKPADNNAHPHLDCNSQIAVVHNGIIENYKPLKENLIKKGHKFTSQTDTEVIPHLIEDFLKEGYDFFTSIKKTIECIEGAYALAIINKKEPDKIIAVRLHSPLIIGLGDNENFIASDIPALLNKTKKTIILEDNELAIVRKDKVEVFLIDSLKPKKKQVHTITWDAISAEKAGYKHFMLKEIHEQPQAVLDTLRGRIVNNTVNLEELNFDKILEETQKINIVACGTAYHAGMVTKYMIEELTGISTEVDLASEFRYRNPIIGRNILTLAISQSGETADTLAAVRLSKSKGSKVLAICNVVGSTLTREADAVLYIRAGCEIGVASTKAFSAQLCACLILALYIAKLKGISYNQEIIIKELMQIPQKLDEILSEKISSNIKECARRYYKYKNFLYLARGINYPIALEGALKLKEISYIHAEGYAGGEMKHGPIALIDENMPTVAIATYSKTYQKMVSNIVEVKSRDGAVIALATVGNKDIKDIVDYVIYVPETIELLSPILNTIPLQLLAYYIAVKRGCDVDQPRNLAKSVTVE